MIKRKELNFNEVAFWKISFNVMDLSVQVDPDLALATGRTPRPFFTFWLI